MSGCSSMVVVYRSVNDNICLPSSSVHAEAVGAEGGDGNSNEAGCGREADDDETHLQQHHTHLCSTPTHLQH